jgi:Cu/Ag efflux protein CusF
LKFRLQPGEQVVAEWAVDPESGKVTLVKGDVDPVQVVRT